MNKKFKNAFSKISNALFTECGEQGLLVKKDGSEFEIFIIKQEKTFSVKGQMLRTAPSIRIKSEVKPELYDELVIGYNRYRLKASGKLINNDIYEVSIE